MSNPSFQPAASVEERTENPLRPNPAQEERKPESVVRPTTQQPPPPHPPPQSTPAQLPSTQPTLQPQVQPVLQTSIIPSQPPTETVKPYTDNIPKALPLQKPAMFVPRTLAPAPAPAPAPAITVSKIPAAPLSNSPLPGQPMTTISALTQTPTIQVPAAAMMKAVAQSTAQVPVPVTHQFASHVPRGIAAAANMSLAKPGAPTAILKPQTTSSATTSVQSILSSSLHPSFQHPSQRFSPIVPPASVTAAQIHTCIALGVTRSSSPIVTSTALTSMQDTHRPATHIQHALGMSLQPQPLPTPQPHLQPQTLTQVPTPPHSQPQTQPQITQQPTTQLPTQSLFSQLRPPMQQDLTRNIPLSAQIQKYVAPGPTSVPSNIPKPIISTAPSMTSTSTTLPSQPVITVSNTTTTTIPPHTAPLATVSSVFTPASLPLVTGPMLATVRSSSAPPTTTSAPTTQQSAPISTIPVAKVYPRQQLPHSPRPQAEFPSDTHPTNILFAAAHRGSPNPAAAAVSVAAAASSSTNLSQSIVTTDSRTDRTIPSISHTTPYTGAIPHTYFYDPLPASYHPMHQYAAFTPISSNAVRQGIVGFNTLPVSSAPQGSQNMAAAAVAAAAHAATVGAAPVRIGPMNLMPIDQRHPMVTLPATISTAASTEAIDTSVAVSGMYALSTSAGPLPSSNNLPNPSASPRPSILRKRTNEGLRKPVVSTPTGSQPGSPKTDSSQSTLSATNSPKLGDLLSGTQPIDMNMESSTNTSAVLAGSVDVKVKQEPQTPSPTDATVQVLAAAHLIPVAQAVEVVGASPRKKPRKQQHIVGREDHDMVESNSTDEADETEHRIMSIPKKSEKTKEDKKHTKDVKYIQYLKRPYKNILDTYKLHWKPTHNHFTKYSDVRVKDKKSSLQDIAGQRGVVQKADGWKIQHIATQLDDLANLEESVFNKMKEIKDGMGPCKGTASSFMSDDEMTQVTELIQGNIQRCKLAMEQMSEAKISMMKLLDHKQKVLSLINKHGNKRSSKKKSSNT